MRYRWPEGTQFTQVVLDVEQEVCALCQRRLHVCDHRFHRILSLQGPLELVCKLAHCPDPGCSAHCHTLSPLAESQITSPWWLIGWDVFCWLGFRRFSRHWSIPQLQAELRDSFSIRLSEDAIAGYLQRYRCMVAARHQDAALLAEHYKDIDELVLTIDGLQPEKGHETLYVVRELRGQRVWFAEALLSSSTDEVRRLLAKAKDWAGQLGKPVVLWMSDKQDAFVQGIAAEFPDVPHRYCQNHFLRDLAKPVLERDSHAKVQMRKRVRGLRAIERQVLAARRQGQAGAEAVGAAAMPDEPAGGAPAAASQASGAVAADQPAASNAAAAGAAGPVGTAGGALAAAGPVTAESGTAGAAVAAAAAAVVEAVDEAGQVVLDYCAAVRGILNDDQGGPLQPPGLRMAAALQEVRASLQRNLGAKKGGPPTSTCRSSRGASTGGCER
jgi:GNAT superfamily N-acetyltransferase